MAAEGGDAANAARKDVHKAEKKPACKAEKKKAERLHAPATVRVTQNLQIRSGPGFAVKNLVFFCCC